MLVFDVLDQLETYAPIIPHMDDVINVMDHSKPYDDDPGEYKCREKGDTTYKVSVHLSSEKGFPGDNFPSHTVVEIVLEGEEMVLWMALSSSYLLVDSLLTLETARSREELCGLLL